MWRAITVAGQMVWSALWVATIACQLMFCNDCCLLTFAYCITVLLYYCITVLLLFAPETIVLLWSLLVAERYSVAAVTACLLAHRHCYLSVILLFMLTAIICLELVFSCMFNETFLNIIVCVYGDLFYCYCHTNTLPTGACKGQGAFARGQIGGNCTVLAYGTRLSCRKLSVRSFGTCGLRT